MAKSRDYQEPKITQEQLVSAITPIVKGLYGAEAQGRIVERYGRVVDVLNVDLNDTNARKALGKIGRDHGVYHCHFANGIYSFCR